jgi:hypothetical protein
VVKNVQFLKKNKEEKRLHWVTVTTLGLTSKKKNTIQGQNDDC